MDDLDNDPRLQDPKWRAAVFGKQVEDFLDSDIGQYLMQMANAEANDAMQKLRKVAPWRTRKIQQLQNQIKVCDSIVNWLSLAIKQGEAAKELIQNE